MADDLTDEMRSHVRESFPASVVKGLDYGEVDAVMIGADIYGWALSISKGSALSAGEHAGLEDAAQQLQRSLSAFPPDAPPYFERILRIAQLALSR